MNLIIRLAPLILLVLAGCARVVPPADVRDPQTVYLTDYGRHSSIVLPQDDTTALEYTYGDWRYYALNQWKWYIGAKALFCSEGATLGRRTITISEQREHLQSSLGARTVTAITVEREAVGSLLSALESRYRSNVQTEIYNDYQRAHFVRDRSRYGLFNTCNTATAGWLRALGCEVSGWALLSRFNVMPRRGTPSPGTPEEARGICDCPRADRVRASSEW